MSDELAFTLSLFYFVPLPFPCLCVPISLSVSFSVCIRLYRSVCWHVCVCIYLSLCSLSVSFFVHLLLSVCFCHTFINSLLLIPIIKSNLQTNIHFPTNIHSLAQLVTHSTHSQKKYTHTFLPSSLSLLPSRPSPSSTRP